MRESENRDTAGHSARDSARVSAPCARVVRAVPGFEKRLVTRDGKVFRKHWSGLVRCKAWTDRDGYLRVKVPTPSGGLTQTGVHRLVALAWLGPPAEGETEVRHIDGDPQNNRVENLRWGSHAANMDDRRGHGRNATGEKNGRAILTETQVRSIKTRLASGESQREIANDLQVNRHTIADISRGRNWKHVTAENDVAHPASGGSR